MKNFLWQFNKYIAIKVLPFYKKFDIMINTDRYKDESIHLLINWGSGSVFEPVFWNRFHLRTDLLESVSFSNRFLSMKPVWGNVSIKDPKLRSKGWNIFGKTFSKTVSLIKPVRKLNRLKKNRFNPALQNTNKLKRPQFMLS